jgi:D-aminoacyl-tRNA deacylase
MYKSQKNNFSGMMCIVTSEKDIASLNVWEILSMMSSQKIGTFDGNPLLKIGKHVLLKTKKDTIFSDDVAKINADVYIFASRHSSKTKKPCLTAHATGNFDEEVIYGGEPKELGVCAADLIGSAIRTMETACPSGFEVSMEVTHHGPTSIRKPMMFIEVGSSGVEWNNIDACRVVADTILNLKSGTLDISVRSTGLTISTTNCSRRW